MTIRSYHMSGAGNAFVVIDGRSSSLLASTIPKFVPALCDRSALHMHAAEGVLVLNDIGSGTATSSFYNPDGTTGAICGNGGRCLVRFALDNGGKLDARHALVFSMAGTVYTATVAENGIICVDFPPPVEERHLDANEILELPSDATYVNVGSDHVVIDTRRLANDRSHISDLPLRDIALPIRYSAAFPRGTNVNLATVVDRHTVHMRTYERGVEAETGACGTGAISTAIVLWQSGEIDADVTIVPTSEKLLRVIIHHHGNVITHVTLCGDAVYDAEPSQFDTSSGTYL